MSAPFGRAAPNAPQPLRGRVRPPGSRARLLSAWLVMPLLSLLLLTPPASALAEPATAALSAGASGRGSTPMELREWVTPTEVSRAPAGSGAGGPAPARARPASPAGEAALFERALATSRAGSFAAALPLWDQVLEQRPQDAAAWSNRGNVRLALGDAEGAIADQTRAMDLDPGHPDPHLNRGTAEEALGRWQAAAADYQWILERDPSEASALYNLGNVNGSLGDWPAARQCFAQAASARPGFAMARSSAALAAFQLGDLEAAEQQLRALIRRYPLFADARAGLTALLWQRGARGEAESHWAAASGLDPRYRQAEWLLGIRRWPPAPVQALEQFLSLSAAAPKLHADP